MALFDVIQPRVIELGKIKIGGLGEERATKSGGKFRLPVKFDHFMITGLHRDARGSLISDQVLMDSLSKEGFADSDGKLRRLPISVMSNDIEDVLQAAYVRYRGKQIEARSDGVTLTKFFDGDKRLDVPIEKNWQPEWADIVVGGQKYWKVHCTFNCVIASKSARWGGVYKFRTTSGISASQLAGSLVEIKQLTGGVLRGMPLRLAVRPMQVSPDGKTTTVYVVHCELVGDDLYELQDRALERSKAELSNMKKINQLQLEYRKLIENPGEESDEEREEIAAEFHPVEHQEQRPVEVDPLAAALGFSEPEKVNEPQYDESGAPVPSGDLPGMEDWRAEENPAR